MRMGEVIMTKNGKNIAETEAKKEKKRACLIVLLSIVCVSLFCLLYHLINKRAELENNEKVHSLYGVWVEKKVSSYSADIFELQNDGVYYNQKKIATSFNLIGVSEKELSFNVTYEERMNCVFFKEYLKCKNPLRHYEQVYEKSKTGYFVKKRV